MTHRFFVSADQLQGGDVHFDDAQAHQPVTRRFNGRCKQGIEEVQITQCA